MKTLIRTLPVTDSELARWASLPVDQRINIRSHAVSRRAPAIKRWPEVAAVATIRMSAVSILKCWMEEPFR